MANIPHIDMDKKKSPYIFPISILLMFKSEEMATFFDNTDAIIDVNDSVTSCKPTTKPVDCLGTSFTIAETPRAAINNSAIAWNEWAKNNQFIDILLLSFIKWVDKLRMK